MEYKMSCLSICVIELTPTTVQVFETIYPRRTHVHVRDNVSAFLVYIFV